MMRSVSARCSLDESRDENDKNVTTNEMDRDVGIYRRDRRYLDSNRKWKLGE